MKSRYFRGDLLASVSKIILGTLALASVSGQSQANSICTTDASTNPQTFSCFDDSVDPANTATGTFSAGATFTDGPYGRLQISSVGALDVILDGQINSTNVSNQYLTSAVYLTAAGPLSYANNGTTTGASTGWLFNTYLRSNQSVTASSGTVVAAGYRVTGLFSETMSGNNTLTGGNTTVSGTWSRGLWTDAFGGHNVTNTGVVTASGDLSRAVIARALSTTDGCVAGAEDLSTTVNVTGDISADFVGIITLTCGQSTVNVLGGNTVAVTGTSGTAIRNIGLTSTVTNIQGSVLAASTVDLALEVFDGASTTTIGGTGLLSGTFAGDNNADTITIAAGGEWRSAGISDFKLGNDAIVNGGMLNANAVTFANLEAFTNNGTLAVTGGTFALVGPTTFTNNGTIEVATGETLITSDGALLNNGSISMQNGLAGDVLTIANNYVAGANAALYIDVSGHTSDMFIVQGATTGTTQLFVSGPETINTSGIMIGTVNGPQGQRALGASANSPQPTFAVGNQTTRLIDFQLEQIGPNVYLTAAPNALAFQPLLVGQVGASLWHQSAEVIANSATLSKDDGGRRARPVSFWGQAYAGRADYGDRSTQAVFGSSTNIDNRLRIERTGVEVGVDAAIGELGIVGLTGGYEKAGSDHRSLEGGVKTSGYNVGAYAHFGRTLGISGSLLVKYDWSNAKLTHDAFDSSSNDPDVRSLGGEATLGYGWTHGAVRFELGAGLSYVDTAVDGFSAEGIGYNYDSIKSVRGSLSAGAEFANAAIVPFVKARLLREFEGNSRLNLVSGAEHDAVNAAGTRTWVRLEGGIKGSDKSGPLLSGWAELGDVQGFGARAGWRF